MNDSELIKVIIYTFNAFIMMALVLILFFYYSRKKIIRQEIEKRVLESNHQKEILRSVILTQESERKRIAQDLHDEISSKLNIISLNSHLLKSNNLADNELFEIANSITDLTTNALDSSRRIAHDLLPPVLEKFGLHAGIEELVSEFNNSKAVTIQYTNQLHFDLEDIDWHLHIFRILQELLNNSMRHGKASEISIVFKKIKGQSSCVYTDNGIGFDTNASFNSNGLGMKNIESRVSFLNGILSVDSKINGGIEVTFTF
jgi:signal transduction histidine kinase